MRVAFLISHPIQYYSPIFRELAKRCDLHVFYGQQLNSAQQASTGFGVGFEWDVDLLAGYNSSVLKNVARNPAPDRFLGCDTPEVGARLREGKFEALIVAGWYLKSHAQAIVAAKRLGIPVLIRGDSHLDTPRSAAKRWAKAVINPAFLRTFDAALYVGHKSRQFYEHYRYPAERLFFSPHCVDNEWFATRATPEARTALRQQRSIRDGATVALFAGKLVPLKRPFDLVRAAGRCRAQGCDLEVMVAGAGELENEMRREAETLRVPVHMLGFCNQSQMPAAYAASDVLVLASDQETWGLVANEALACGRPIVVTDACGCAPDLAADGTAGRVVPVGDHNALASAIQAVSENSCLEDAIGRKAQAYSVAAAVNGMMMALNATNRLKARA